MTPAHGKVWLDGEHIQHYASKEVARRIGLLAQNATTREILRYRSWLPADATHTSRCLPAGGKRMKLRSQTPCRRRVSPTWHHKVWIPFPADNVQRAWIAMVLAQETSIMLLDEPTTWLDISHQIDLLELLSELNREKGYTLAAVLHDLNQACRYATHLIALRDGKIIAEGAPKEIVTAQLIEKIYGLRCMIIDDPVTGKPVSGAAWTQQITRVTVWRPACRHTTIHHTSC